MNCKYCGAELEENQLVCPVCGGDNQQAQPETEICLEKTVKEEIAPKKPKWSKKKIAKLVTSIVAGLLVVALIAGSIAWLNLRKSHEVSGFLAGLSRNAVVATMGDYELTNGQFQVFYWMQVYDLIEYYTNQFGQYATYYLGLDTTKPLSEQIYNETTGETWEQYFIKDAIYAWQRYQALADEAKQVGFQLPAEYIEEFANMEATMDEAVRKEGFESVDSWLQSWLGENVTFDDYYYYLETFCLGQLYREKVTSELTFTDAELEEYFTTNADVLLHYGITKDSGLLVDVRSISIKPISTKDENGNSVYTEEAWATCLEKAQAVLDTWLAGEKTEASFAELATKKSEDSSTASNGGLNQYVAKDEWVTVDVRHILIKPTGGTKDTATNTITYSDAEWEACRESAQALLDQYLAGEKTEDAFGAMANEHSDDQGGKVTDGGIYKDVYKGKMVKAFEEWCFDATRTPGETGLVKTEFGYHIMYFVARNGAVNDWIFAEDRKVGDVEMVKTQDGYQILYYVDAEEGWRVYSQDGLLIETAENLVQSYVDARPVDVRNWAIMIAPLAETETET